MVSNTNVNGTDYSHSQTKRLNHSQIERMIHQRVGSILNIQNRSSEQYIKRYLELSEGNGQQYKREWNRLFTQSNKTIESQSNRTIIKRLIPYALSDAFDCILLVFQSGRKPTLYVGLNMMQSQNVKLNCVKHLVLAQNTVINKYENLMKPNPSSNPKVAKPKASVQSNGIVENTIIFI
eukprot:826046_1